MWMRFIRLLIKWLFFTKEEDVLKEKKLTFRVGLTDIDYNLHLNNAKYLSFMDLGRFDLTFKCGLAKPLIKNKWKVMAAAVNIIYRKQIAPFEKFELVTKILCWDEKWFYIEQDFITKNGVAAKAIVKAGFLDKKLLAPQDVIKAMGRDDSSPIMPTYLEELVQGEKDFIQYTINK